MWRRGFFARKSGKFRGYSVRAARIHVYCVSTQVPFRFGGGGGERKTWKEKLDMSTRYIQCRLDTGFRQSPYCVYEGLLLGVCDITMYI